LGRVRPSPGGRGRAAELASEAARAEGASTTATRRGRRADRSAIRPTAHRGVAGGLEAAGDLAEQPGPLLRIQGISSRTDVARRRLASRAAARRQPWQQEAEWPARVANSAKGLASSQAAQRFAGTCWTGGQEPLGSWGITRFLSWWLLRGSLGCWPRRCWRTAGAACVSGRARRLVMCWRSFSHCSHCKRKGP
jgi:hypothetical protein